MNAKSKGWIMTKARSKAENLNKGEKNWKEHKKKPQRE